MELADVDQLVAEARGPDAGRRDAAIAALVRALHDEQPLARAEAADALGPLGDRRVGPELAKALRADPESMVRAAAAESLGDLADPAHLPAVVDAVRTDPDPSVRAYAAATPHSGVGCRRSSGTRRRSARRGAGRPPPAARHTGGSHDA
jgi:HEAT repeat protein